MVFHISILVGRIHLLKTNTYTDYIKSIEELGKTIDKEEEATTLINELKKLHTSLIFNIKVLITINSTHNLYAIFARILDICKQLTSNLAA